MIQTQPVLHYRARLRETKIKEGFLEGCICLLNVRQGWGWTG